MRILAFAACILVVVTVGDAFLSDIEEVLKFTSKIQFDIKELIDFHVKYIECVKTMGLSKIIFENPELSFCVAQKNNFIDAEGGVLWDKAYTYVMKIIRDATTMEPKVQKLFKKCKKEADEFEGSKYEKSLKVFECGMPLGKYIAQQLITL